MAVLTRIEGVLAADVATGGCVSCQGIVGSVWQVDEGFYVYSNYGWMCRNFGQIS